MLPQEVGLGPRRGPIVLRDHGGLRLARCYLFLLPLRLDRDLHHAVDRSQSCGLSWP